SGIINLGIEGMMLAAAMTAALTSSIWGGILGAAAMSAIFGLFAIVLRADQIVTGTAVNLLALGLTGFIDREMQQTLASPAARAGTDLVVPLAWIALPLALAFLLWRTMFGLRLRACGENPEAVGGLVPGLRWTALAIESVLVGIGGGHLALVL